MRVSRLFVTSRLQTGQHIELDEAASHYVRTVLRLKAEENILVFNGAGGEFLCRLVEVSRKSVRLKIEKYLERHVESPLNINLGMGISRGDRMDWAVQKAVELGVTRLTPLMTERCVSKLPEDKKSQRQQHWRNILVHAAEQCGRTNVPELSDISDISAWINRQAGLKVFLDPYAELTLGQIPKPVTHITLLSGPEGGFSEPERQFAKASGFTPVRMGARILRTETAVLSALAAVQTLWGDF